MNALAGPDGRLPDPGGPGDFGYALWQEWGAPTVVQVFEALGAAIKQDPHSAALPNYYTKENAGVRLDMRLPDDNCSLRAIVAPTAAELRAMAYDEGGQHGLDARYHVGTRRYRLEGLVVVSDDVLPDSLKSRATPRVRKAITRQVIDPILLGGTSSELRLTDGQRPPEGHPVASRELLILAGRLGLDLAPHLT